MEKKYIAHLSLRFSIRKFMYQEVQIPVFSCNNIMLYKTSKFESTNNHQLKWLVIVTCKFDQIDQLRTIKTSQMSIYTVYYIPIENLTCTKIQEGEL